MDDLDKLTEIYPCSNCKEYFHRDDMQTHVLNNGKGTLYCNSCGDFIRDIKKLNTSLNNYVSEDKQEHWNLDADYIDESEEGGSITLQK